ncbi:hypothetical protein SAVERM_4397 [Streptomyces avermitilis MA-4680 = NBRC 14893]|uniref:Uncharacterized protein n=1 Tax=Streptomyces avermitilis (strain ATCC 31267 / DSM 46492 / JCM 5070 / NBRC 14893 / NCIMB 12804 / NRRL 8165 / MA-4680) TaxID=227882 RepID=Q82F66_STRAW|nr:hypothetical protein SAVERM_4397 [Streptomyces avermitilis MA-4680 = NBRC 14893]
MVKGPELQEAGVPGPSGCRTGSGRGGRLRREQVVCRAGGDGSAEPVAEGVEVGQAWSGTSFGSSANRSSASLTVTAWSSQRSSVSGSAQSETR